MSGTQPAISAKPLADNLYAVGAAVLHAQGRALVMERQVSLQVLRDPTGVGAAAAGAQVNMRDAAGYYLNVVQPKAIALFAATDGVTNLVKALNSLTAAATLGDDAPHMLIAVADAMDQLSQKAQDTAKATQSNADLTAKAAQQLSTALTAAITKLEGDKGEIAQARGQIDATEAAIFKAINDIVKSANVVGGGIKGLVTYVLGFLGGDADKDKKDKAKPDPKEAKAKPTGKPGEKPADDSGEIAPFPAESIDTISTGVEGVVEAQATIKAKNALLVQQYQYLAALGALLAAGQAISSQTHALATTAGLVNTAVRETADVTAQIAEGFRALATQAATPADLKAVRAQITASVASWTQLETQLRQTGSTLAGIGKLFPPLTNPGR